MDVIRRRVEVAVGVSLQTWEIDGRGPNPTPATFLLVHGLASNARLWDYTALELARLGHRVAAVDLRGHGESDKPDGGYDFQTLVSDLVSISGSLGLERPVLAGQSFGGNLVLETAWRHPSVSSGIVCVDGGTIELSRTFSNWDDVARVLAPPKLAGMKRDAIYDAMRQAHPDWPTSGVDSTMGNFEVFADGTIAPRLSRENHMKILHALWENKPSTRFETVQVPALIVYAGAPGSGPFDKERAAKQAEDRIAKVRVVWFEDADHDIHAQFPLRLADLMNTQVENGFFDVESVASP